MWAARLELFRSVKCTSSSRNMIVLKIVFSLMFMFGTCFSSPGISAPPSEEYSLELQDIVTENHDNLFKRWSRKPIGSGLVGGYSLCEEGFLLTKESGYLTIMDLNSNKLSLNKINFKNYALVSCLGVSKDGGLIVFSKKINTLSEEGGAYRILRVGNEVVEISSAINYYHDDNGVLEIICGDEICLNNVYKHTGILKGFQTIRGQEISADVTRNFILKSINLRGYNTYLKKVNGVVDPSKLFCAPYQPPFLIEAQDIKLCADSFQKYIYASQSIFIDNFVIIRMDDPPVLDEICDLESKECRQLPLGSATPFRNYRMKGDVYYQYGNNEWGLGPFNFCKNKINRNCFYFNSNKEAVVSYFEINDKRFTISMEYRAESPEDVIIGAHYINYAAKR